MLNDRCEFVQGKGGVCAADAALEFPVDKSELDVGYLERTLTPVEQIYKLTFCFVGSSYFSDHDRKLLLAVRRVIDQLDPEMLKHMVQREGR